MTQRHTLCDFDASGALAVVRLVCGSLVGLAAGSIDFVSAGWLAGWAG